MSEEQMIRLPLTPDARKRLDREHRGRGGFESLLRRLRTQIVDGGEAVMVSPRDWERLIKYTTLYGEGGFENRLRPVGATKKR